MKHKIYTIDHLSCMGGVPSQRTGGQACQLCGTARSCLRCGIAAKESLQANASYWKPCGHGVGVICNCPNNGEPKPPAGRDGQPERYKCTCPLLNLAQEGCKCGAIDPYKAGGTK